MLSMDRVAIVGSSGSGKTWLASRLAGELDVAHVELDAIHHGPGWAAATAEVTRHELDSRCPSMVHGLLTGTTSPRAEGLVRERAGTVIWLDVDGHLRW